jgi:hypothetical protein
MKDLLKNAIKTNGDFIDFETDDSIGHVQFDKDNWTVFLNSKCVHVSKTLNPALRKLDELGITEFNLILE